MLTLSRKEGEAIIIAPPSPESLLELIRDYASCDVLTQAGLRRSGELVTEIKKRLEEMTGRITIEVVECDAGKVRLRTGAPNGTTINRKEIQDQIDAGRGGRR